LKKVLFRKLFEGTATKEEIAEILHWLSRQDIDQELLGELKLFISRNQSHPAEEEFDKNQQWKRLMEKLEPETKGKSGRSLTTALSLMKVAATISLLFTLAIYFFAREYRPNQEVPVVAVANITKTTQSGQKSTIFLPDGSSVVLNSESSITYPEYFSDTLRQVQFSGEAFFEVLRDTTRAFEILSGELTTRVLGTSFNLRNREGEKEMRVALVSGKVAVEMAAAGSREINPGQEVVVNRQKRQFDVQPFDPEYTCAWKDGILYFKDTSFEEVIGRLQTWYGVNIEVIGRPKQPIYYSGKFINENLENVLHGIGFIMHFNFQLEKRNVMIEFR
jgi:ferric-dicitrate binding protein FerR (iron transport regulator)